MRRLLEKIQAKVSAVADIADVQGDFKGKIVAIVPKQWSEAVAAGSLGRCGKGLQKTY